MAHRRQRPLAFKVRSVEEMSRRASEYYEEMRLRRSVRMFSDRIAPREVIENCVRTAAAAPSGANQQPWHFVVVADPVLKRAIRTAAEEEERKFYLERAPQSWLEALEPLGTGVDKPFLESASHLIVVFAQAYGLDAKGHKVKHYYVMESVGIATGFLITALHHAGLATLTHTPSPMGFLSNLLERPANERAYLIVVTGYPADNALVPVIDKKPFSEIATFL